MKRIFLAAMLMVFSFHLASLAAAANPEEISVKEAAVASSIKDLAPEGAAKNFPSNAGNLYCYSLIINGQGSSIVHKWYHKGNLRAAVPLAIRYPRHRTYSKKTVFPGSAGDW